MGRLPLFVIPCSRLCGRWFSMNISKTAGLHHVDKEPLSQGANLYHIYLFARGAMYGGSASLIVACDLSHGQRVPSLITLSVLITRIVSSLLYWLKRPSLAAHGEAVWCISFSPLLAGADCPSFYGGEKKSFQSHPRLAGTLSLL